MKTITLAVYQIIWWFCPFFARYYLRRRARKSPEYLNNWDERFAQPCSSPLRRKVIWIHAVSVGETRAAEPIICALQKCFPDVPLLITQMTPTGRQTALQLYPEADVRYLPYDKRQYVKQFLADYQPLFGLLMETEIWPNLIHSAKAANIPLFLVNARLSEKSRRAYWRIRSLIRPAIGALTAIAAQSEDDAVRLRQLGAQNICVCGNSKYDVRADARQLELGRLFAQRIGNRRVVLCASTRDGEEELILDAWQKISANNKTVLLLIVPRHPERFALVEQLAKSRNYSIQRRSENRIVSLNTQILLGDSLGEMFAYYALADLAFIGGSLMSLGGQNLIEAAYMGVPILFGLSMFNFQQASELALKSGAARQVYDVNDLIIQINLLLDCPQQMQQMREAALTFSRAHSGASERCVKYLCQFLP